MEQADVVFQIILHGGNARSFAMEAITSAKRGDFEEARRALNQSSKELGIAHQIQTTLLQQEASGEGVSHASLLMVHAQDHLMNAMTVKDLAKEFVELYEHMSQNGRVQI